MASVEPRQAERPDGSIRKFYLVRWRDPAGKDRSRSFDQKGPAHRFKTNIEADLLRDEYIDPSAGKVTFEEYATEWLTAQTFDLATREATERRLRLHAFPVLGDKSLRRIKPSTVQSWLGSLKGASSSHAVLFANVSTIFSAAVDDEVIRKNPCRANSVRRPQPEKGKVTPWSAAQVGAVRAGLMARYRLLVTLGAGLGLRQGEVFGLSPDDVDFLRGKVTVRRQVKLLSGGRMVFALPKGRKEREVPLPDSVRDAMAMYLTLHPAVTVSLPWATPDGKVRAAPLVMTNSEGRALNRNTFNKSWKKALLRAGVEPTRENGCHALRHYYASTLLDAGESIKALSEYLGHADAGFTLRTYTHLMPSSDNRTKKAVDAAMCVIDVESAAAEKPKAQVSGG